MLEYQDPSNAVRAGAGRTLPDMLVSGESDAAIGAGHVEPPDVRPLVPNARDAAVQWYKKAGIYPINHMVVVKNSLLESHPWIAAELFAAFKAAKEGYVNRLGAAAPSGDDEAMLWLKGVIGGDPLPYGVAQNRKGLETVLEWAHESKIIPRKFSVEELFSKETVGLE